MNVLKMYGFFYCTLMHVFMKTSKLDAFHIIVNSKLPGEYFGHLYVSHWSK